MHFQRILSMDLHLERIIFGFEGQNVSEKDQSQLRPQLRSSHAKYWNKSQILIFTQFRYFGKNRYGADLQFHIRNHILVPQLFQFFPVRIFLFLLFSVGFIF